MNEDGKSDDSFDFESNEKKALSIIQESQCESIDDSVSDQGYDHNILLTKLSSMNANDKSESLSNILNKMLLPLKQSADVGNHSANNIMSQVS